MPWRGQLSWCVGRRPEKGQKMPDEHPKPARAAATGAVLIAACNQSPHELDHEMSVHDLPGGRVRLRVGSSHRASGPQRAGVAAGGALVQDGGECDAICTECQRIDETRPEPPGSLMILLHIISTGPHVRCTHALPRTRAESRVHRPAFCVLDASVRIFWPLQLPLAVSAHVWR